MRQILSSWSVKGFKRSSTAKIIVSALLFSALQVVAVSVSPTASAAVSPEPYGLNYERNYFQVSGGLSPSNSNFTVEAYVRVNANVPSGDTPESLIIIGNAETLSADTKWQTLITFFRFAGCYVNGEDEDIQRIKFLIN
jgi:hypothetical protein